MANRKENSRGQGKPGTGNQQGTTRTGAQNSGGQRADQDNDTSRTSNEGRKLASGGSKDTNNRGQERG